MLEGSLALACLDGFEEANSIAELSNVFDTIGGDFGVDGFAVARVVSIGRVTENCARLCDPYGMVHVDSDVIVASHSPSYRIILATGMVGWLRCEEHLQSSYDPIIAGSISRVGLEAGVTIPTRSADGVNGMVSLLTTRRAPLMLDLVKVVALGIALHSRVERLDARARAASPLSPREHEVIAWLAEGKSADDVASIVGISPATVMFHYRNVALKFGTLNRTHTVVEALRRGELQLEIERPRGAPVAAYDSYTI